MADRTSAGLFGLIFKLLAKHPGSENKRIAIQLWPERTNYDFSDYQMDCDEALIKLGLARRSKDDEEEIIYNE